jgi:hypothetical protein
LREDFPAGALLRTVKMEDVKRTRPILVPFLLVALLLHGNPLLAVPEQDTVYFQWVCNFVLPLTSEKSLAMVRAHLCSLFIAATTLMAVAILAIVVLHILAN